MASIVGREHELAIAREAVEGLAGGPHALLIEGDAALAAEALAERVPERGGLEALGTRLGDLNAAVRAELAETDAEAEAPEEVLDTTEQHMPVKA